MKRLLVFTAWYPTPDNPHAYTFVSQQVKILQSHLKRCSGEDWKLVVWHQVQSIDIPGVLFKARNKLNLNWRDEDIEVFSRQGMILSHRWKSPQRFMLHGNMNKTYHEIETTLMGTPDLVWTVTLSSALNWRAFSIRYKKNIPYILQEHSNTIWMHLKNKQNIRDASSVFQEAAKLVVVAERQIEQIQKIVPGAQPVVIWNAVAPIYMQPVNSNVTNHQIIFVGRLSHEKGLVRLIHALHKIHIQYPEARLTLVGQGSEKQILENELKLLNLQDRVEFVGAKRPEEIAALLDRSAVFVLASDYENCPVALLEAQARGVPCLVRNNQASEKVLLSGNGLAVNDIDGEGLAPALSKLLDTLNEFDRATIQARAIREFSPEVFADKMFKVFQEVIR